MNKIKIKKLHDKAILPHYATDGASAFDLFCYEEPKWQWNCDKYWVAIVHTGWAFEIPKEHGMFILSRSGHGFKNNTTLANSVGLLDFDYRGEAMVKLICFDRMHPHIKKGQAIAQVAILHTPRQYFEVVNGLSNTSRGANGFGSTDK